MKRNRPTEVHSPTGDGKGRDLSGHERNPTARDALTSWRRQKEGLVRSREETNRPRPTHKLETAEGGTCQDTERHQQTEAHSLPGDGRRRDFVRTHKKPDWLRCAHQLEMVEGGTCQGTGRNRWTEAHSRPVDSRGRNLSGHRKKSTG